MGEGARGDRREAYSLGYGAEEQERLARRRAAEAAGFLLPHLRAGTRVLDCGCGPGSITLDLAAVVAPGEVVGVDLEPRQVQGARALAAERGVENVGFAVENVGFAVGDVYALPFADGSFDAVFANTVMTHLRHPVAVLQEVRRVLRPGGVAGVRDVDHWVVAPPTSTLDAYLDLVLKVRAFNGGAFGRARHQRAWLLEAGFARSEGTVDWGAAAAPEATREFAATNAAWLREPAFRAVALGQGWADEAGLAAMETELRAWGDRADGFWGVVLCAAVGWVGG